MRFYDFLVCLLWRFLLLGLFVLFGRRLLLCLGLVVVVLVFLGVG